MTAPNLTPAERATVERFEQAPDALNETNVCERHHFVWTWPIEGGSGSIGVCDLCGAVTTGERDARMVAEAADAREAEVRARVDSALKSLGRNGDYVLALAVRQRFRAALAPADNDGEASHG